jgi:hypothetical protein
MTRLEQRAQILFDYGASLQVVDEMLKYSHPVPLEVAHEAAHRIHAPELHLSAWQTYAEEAERIGVLPALQKRLPQLRFPIQAQISQSDAYYTATRLGKPTDGGGVLLEHPDRLRLVLHQTPIGRLPVVIAHGRHDFVSLVQAFASKNEPEPVLDSMGACIIFNYLNWDRIDTLRRDWEAANEYPPLFAEAYWREEWRERIAPMKSLYRDTFILLSDGNYSGIGAEAVQQPADAWREESLQIRLEHEVLHYVMRCLLPVRPSPIIEEMVADWRGMVAVWENYHADHFLRFIGLEAFPIFREGGRLELYRGTPPLSEEAFALLCHLVRDASLHLATLYNTNRTLWATERGQWQFALALTSLTVEELASPHYYHYGGEALRAMGVAPTPITLPIPIAVAADR